MISDLDHYSQSRWSFEKAVAFIQKGLQMPPMQGIQERILGTGKPRRLCSNSILEMQFLQTAKILVTKYTNYLNVARIP